ncbi:hypothetical protein BKA70DRAFT_1257652 [Coprinopsis sp. MPI-PUGE-AT-0042]|nr:hypothetical protein BKA70DRAFT_1257652 [Coprinopsis sp. MPI-PUGE-AT-0042]
MPALQQLWLERPARCLPHPPTTFTIAMLTTVAARTSLRSARGFRTSAVARSAGHDYHHLPFAWPGDKKVSFGTKLGVFLAFGFSIPFVASAYQLKKAAGGA